MASMCASDAVPRAAVVLMAGWLLVAIGCRPAAPVTPADATAADVDSAVEEKAARALFEHTTVHFHQPSAATTGAGQRRLQDAAAAGYQELLRLYPRQEAWAAQALRSLANIRAAQTNLTEAVELYGRVAQTYSNQTWEALVSLKSAADLLWDHDRKAESRRYYQMIVERFEHPDAPQVVRTILTVSRSRMESRL